jgi:hypothetical protein
VEAKGKD